MPNKHNKIQCNLIQIQYNALQKTNGEQQEKILQQMGPSYFKAAQKTRVFTSRALSTQHASSASSKFPPKCVASLPALPRPSLDAHKRVKQKKAQLGKSGLTQSMIQKQAKEV